MAAIGNSQNRVRQDQAHATLLRRERHPQYSPSEPSTTKKFLRLKG